MVDKITVLALIDQILMVDEISVSLNTVSALLKPRGSIFQNGFLGGVLLIFDLPGVVIKTGFYELVPFLSVSILRK